MRRLIFVLVSSAGLLLVSLMSAVPVAAGSLPNHNDAVVLV